MTLNKNRYNRRVETVFVLASDNEPRSVHFHSLHRTNQVPGSSFQKCLTGAVWHTQATVRSGGSVGRRVFLKAASGHDYQPEKTKILHKTILDSRFHGNDRDNKHPTLPSPSRGEEIN